MNRLDIIGGYPGQGLKRDSKCKYYKVGRTGKKRCVIFSPPEWSKEMFDDLLNLTNNNENQALAIFKQINKNVGKPLYINKKLKTNKDFDKIKSLIDKYNITTRERNKRDDKGKKRKQYTKRAKKPTKAQLQTQKEFEKEDFIIEGTEDLLNKVDKVLDNPENQAFIKTEILKGENPDIIEQQTKQLQILEKQKEEFKIPKTESARKQKITKIENRKKKTDKDLRELEFLRSLTYGNGYYGGCDYYDCDCDCSIDEEGGNIFRDIGNKVKDIFSIRLGFNNVSTRTLEKYGDLPIQRLMIFRTPVSAMLPGALNLLSFGKFNQLIKNKGYDNLFHLALVASVQDPDVPGGIKNIIIEKNEVINISTTYTTKDTTQYLEIDLRGKVFNIKEMLEEARRNVGDEKFFSYDAFNNNCQWFIRYNLEAIGLYTPESQNFLFQDLRDIHRQLPGYVGTIANIATTSASILNKLLGKGIDIDELDDKDLEKAIRQCI